MENEKKEVTIRARVSKACRKQLNEIVKRESKANPDYTLSDALRTAIGNHPALRGGVDLRAEAIAAIDEVGPEKAAKLLRRAARN